MKKQKRIPLSHGSARVDKDCSKETIQALDEMSKKTFNCRCNMTSQDTDIKEGETSDYGERMLEIEDNCNKKGQRGTSVN